jgi:lactose/L-arabinose transport system permease protein
MLRGQPREGPVNAARLERTLLPYVFIAPFYLLFLVFGLLPLVGSFGMSLYAWRGATPGAFVGMGNYLALTQDPAFLHAFLNTGLLWIGIVPTITFIALVLAVILDSKGLKGRNFFRSVFFLPVLTSLVVASLVFTIIFDPSNGVLAMVLPFAGIPPIDFRTSPYFAVPLIIMIVLWRWIGYVVVIQLAGLQTLPHDVLEAARIDGASGPRTFFSITIPLMRPVLVFTTILATIGVFGIFDEPYVLYGTGGGPGESAIVLGTLMYRSAFQFFQLGYASAVGYVVMASVFVVSLVQLRFGRPQA